MRLAFILDLQHYFFDHLLSFVVHHDDACDDDGHPGDHDCYACHDDCYTCHDDGCTGHLVGLVGSHVVLNKQLGHCSSLHVLRRLSFLRCNHTDPSDNSDTMTVYLQFCMTRKFILMPLLRD